FAGSTRSTLRGGVSKRIGVPVDDGSGRRFTLRVTIASWPKLSAAARRITETTLSPRTSRGKPRVIKRLLDRSRPTGVYCALYTLIWKPSQGALGAPLLSDRGGSHANRPPVVGC